VESWGKGGEDSSTQLIGRFRKREKYLGCPKKGHEKESRRMEVAVGRGMGGATKEHFTLRRELMMNSRRVQHHGPRSFKKDDWGGGRNRGARVKKNKKKKETPPQGEVLEKKISRGERQRRKTTK